jgi:transcriptional regulator with XRE-family HTH domain
MFLSKNLKFLRESNKRQSQEALANALGVTRSAISSYEDGRAEPKLLVMNKIATYFNVTLDQLLNSDLAKQGDITSGNKDITKEMKKIVHVGQSGRVLTVTVDQNHKQNIELVPHKSSLGYIQNYDNLDFLKELPKYNLPTLSENRTYRAFELNDSGLPSNSIVIGEYIQNWNEIKNDKICIIVSKTKGIILKRLFNKIADKGIITLKSINISHAPFDMPVEDVIEIWEFVSYISKEFPEEGTSVPELRTAFARLEDDVRELKLKLKQNTK